MIDLIKKIISPLKAIIAFIMGYRISSYKTRISLQDQELKNKKRVHEKLKKLHDKFSDMRNHARMSGENNSKPSGIDKDQLQ